MAKKQDGVIDVRKDGPYIVKNVSTFTNSEGKKITSEETMALCRCGCSQNKPFCDGTHGKVGFSGKLEKDRSKDKRLKFKGKEVDILDNHGICSHAGFCDGDSPKVFWTFENGYEKRIAHPDKGDKNKTIETIKKCPSGALSYAIKGKIFDEQDRKSEIFVSKDGPYYVRGYPLLKDDIGSKPDSEEHYALCRCGGSKNKPFCDGTHRHNGFSDKKN